jgi:hypothetical protein
VCPCLIESLNYVWDKGTNEALILGNRGFQIITVESRQWPLVLNKLKVSLNWGECFRTNIVFCSRQKDLGLGIQLI